SDSGNPDLLRLGAVLLRRYVAFDRGQCHHGYGGAGSGVSTGASVRGTDPQIETAGTPPMTIELARRIAITIGALLIFRLGSYIPLPGISTQGGPLSSGHVARISIFSLSLVPYLSAAIIIQLVSVVWKSMSALERSGEAGRRRIARYTLVLTLLLAAFQ